MKLQELNTLTTDTKKVVDLNVSTLSYSQVLDTIFNLAESRLPSYVCFANAHMAVEARLNKKIAESVNNATIVTSDGMSVVMALKYLHKIKQDRTAGMDMIYDLLRGAEIKHQSVFLFGSDESTMKSFVVRAMQNHPRLKIAGTIVPPFTEFTPEENQAFINKINDSNAQLVIVSLGCPKQELWMAQHSHKVNATMLGVGAAFTLYADKLKRAPEFMQKNGLEWLYRLYQEPKRLWKRYLVTNTLFIIYFIKQLFSKK